MTNNTRRADGAGKPNMNLYNRLNPDEFVDNAKTLVELGWHPVPLGGLKGKTLLVRGVTGHDGEDIHDEDTFRVWADTWSASEVGLNLGVRMPPRVIGIDVDCYEGKPGVHTLDEYEKIWGALPSTWSVTARRDGSRKMFFRVPADWTSRGVLGPGVEVIQRHHRYSVVPPSIHGRGRVCAYAPDGHDCGQLPPPDELPDLPEAWVRGLAHDAATAPKGSVAEATTVAASFRDGPMSPLVHRHVDSVLAAVADGAGRYDAMRDAVMGLARLGSRGERGVPAALRMIETEYVAAVTGTRDETTALGEYGRAKDDALKIVASGGLMDFHTGTAFEPGGAWHRDTGWVRDGEHWVRGVSNSAGDTRGESTVRFATVSASDLAKPVPPMEWLVRGVWPRKSFGPMGGAKKTLKSYNLLSVAVAVASGAPLFGEFEVVSPGPVVFYVGEGGQAPFQRRLQAIAHAYGVDLRDLPLHAVFEVGALDGQDFTDALKRNMDDLQPELVIVDPLYAFHPSGIEAQNLYERGRMLAGVSSLVANDTALIIADHFRKTGNQGALDLDSIAQSGMSQWADSWILQNHREPVDLATGSYRLEVEFGSRQWGGSRWDLDWQLPAFGQLEEGEQDAGVSWAIRRTTDGDGSQAKGQRRSRGTKRSEILTAIRSNPFQFTQNQLVEAVGGNRGAVKKELARLEEDGHVVTDHIAATEGNGRQVARLRYGIAPNATFRMNEGVPG
jgi:hypothetical protein